MQQACNPRLSDDQSDPGIISRVLYRIVESGGKVTALERKQHSKDVRVLLKQLKKLSIVEGVLMRKTATFTQIVLPEKFWQMVYKELHEKLSKL